MKRDHDLKRSVLKFKLNSKLQTTLKSFPNSENWWIEESIFSYVSAMEETLAGPTFVFATFLPGDLFSAKGCERHYTIILFLIHNPYNMQESRY